ncbi:exo-beta-N-acetylmuramidase NamZ domain-containing protein [Winogradskyella litorisediminis]|uniref:Exo-beta-N-acetylmuramidase NamZ domain-containing protein n=1 Tax=Winogradskyella litorisediminis TaxID=1156618 RepID=A0ABW3N9W8_9FLAO
MGLNLLKNTVLFKITIGILFIVLACGNGRKSEVGSLKLEVESDSTEVENSEIIVGANRVEKYLPLLKGKHVGIVANQTSVIFEEKTEMEMKPHPSLSGQYGTFIISTSIHEHLVDSLLNSNINITKVFSPEHGFRGKADAGAHVEDGVDKKTGLPIFSLHGKNKKPTTEQLKDLDIVVFDIQDVGVRFYTYISTLHYVMEACAEQNIPVLVLDRPNPNGSYIDGPTLEKEHSSFLGMHPIPLVHGMTIGEYAQMINGEGWLANKVKADLTVIPVKNYSRDMTYSLPIRPSPNLPNDQSILLYPSLGLFEGTTINAGRGTEFQFQRYGAPYLDTMNYKFSYTPKANFGSKYPKHKGEVCYGEDLSEVKVERKFTLTYIIEAYKSYAGYSNKDKWEFFNTENFTKHAGTKKLQKQIESGKTEIEIKKTWESDLESFKKMREPYLIYNGR